MAEELFSNGIGYYAMRLALTRTIAEENEIKKTYAEKKLRFVVTETGGKSSVDFQGKLSRAVIGASLNGNVVEKNPPEIHALIHAMEEAKKGVLINGNSESNLALKIAIVRNEHWIAVAMFGESALHLMTSHERCGLGIMHI